jgi:hypothetical protein
MKGNLNALARDIVKKARVELARFIGNLKVEELDTLHLSVKEDA